MLWGEEVRIVQPRDIYLGTVSAQWLLPKVKLAGKTVIVLSADSKKRNWRGLSEMHSRAQFDVKMNHGTNSDPQQ